MAVSGIVYRLPSVCCARNFIIESLSPSGLPAAPCHPSPVREGEDTAAGGEIEEENGQQTAGGEEPTASAAGTEPEALEPGGEAPGTVAVAEEPAVPAAGTEPDGEDADGGTLEAETETEPEEETDKGE